MYINLYQCSSMYFYLYLLISICIFLSGQTWCFGQNTDNKKLESIRVPSYFNLTKTNPFTPLWGCIPYTAEYRIVQELTTAKKQSLEISASYLGKSWLLIVLQSLDTMSYLKQLIISGFRFQMAYKFYLKETKFSPEGFYFAPHLSYSYANITDRVLKNSDEFIQIVHFNVNILFGVQFITKKSYAVDIFYGIGYKKNNWYEYDRIKGMQNVDNDMGILYNSPVKFIFGFNAGIAY